MLYALSVVETIVEWNSSREIQTLTNGHDLGGFKPGDTIAIIGEVRKVTMSSCDDGNKESSVEYVREETRKL